MTALKFPRGTLLLVSTELLLPAGNQAVCSAPLIDQQKIELPFDMSGDGPPSLLIAVYRFQRHAEEFSQLLLCLAKLFPG